MVLYKKDYKHFGNSIIKLVCSGKMNIKIITDRHEIIFDNKIYSMAYLGDITKVDRDTLILKFIEIVFNIVKSDDWRLAGQEKYLLYAKLKEAMSLEYSNSSDNPKMFHEHSSFCLNKVKKK